MKNTLLIVTLSTMLSACAVFSPEATPDSEQTAALPAALAAALPASDHVVRKLGAKAVATKEEEALPAVALTPEILFKLTSAEVAYQRGQWQSAYITLMSAAQQTRDPRIARRATEIAMTVKQPGEALAAIRLWRELAPQSEEATQYFLGFVIIGDNLEEAKPILERRLKEARPQERGVLMVQMQRILARAKNKAAGFAMLEELLAPYQTMQEARLALAQGAFANGDTERATNEARAALAAKPHSELAVLTLAQVTPNTDAALKILADFLQANPKSSEVRIAYARFLVDQKQYDKARSEFETALKALPHEAAILYALGMLDVQVNDPKSAEKHFTAYIKELDKQPDDERDPTQALLVLAQIAEDRGDIKGALGWLAKVEPGDGSNNAYFSTQLKRAQLIAKDSDLTAAHKFLMAVSTDNPREQAQVVMAEAQILRDANQPQQAFAVLDAGLKRFPDNTDLLYDFAIQAEKANQLTLMESTLRKIIELAPNNQHAYNALGYSLAERNLRLPEAAQLIDQALKIAPDDPFILDSKGWVEYRLGNLAAATELLRRAYQIRPDPEIAVHLGEVLWAAGQTEDAQKFWREVQQKDPKNDALKNTLERLKASI